MFDFFTPPQSNKKNEKKNTAAEEELRCQENFHPATPDDLRDFPCPEIRAEAQAIPETLKPEPLGPAKQAPEQPLSPAKQAPEQPEPKLNSRDVDCQESEKDESPDLCLRKAFFETMCVFV